MSLDLENFICGFIATNYPYLPLTNIAIFRTSAVDVCFPSCCKWSAPGEPRGLSVTPSGNLLVTCREPNKLVELSVDSGKSVREIELQSDIEDPWRSVQLTTGQFVVCHGLFDLQRVCVVGDDGKVTRSYGGEPGSDVGQLDYPRHLAVDKTHSLYL